MKLVSIISVFLIVGCGRPVVFDGEWPEVHITKPQIVSQDSMIVIKYEKLSASLNFHNTPNIITVLIASDTVAPVTIDFVNFSISYVKCGDTLKPHSNVSKSVNLKPFGFQQLSFEYDSSVCQDSIKDYFITGDINFRYLKSYKSR